MLINRVLLLYRLQARVLAEEWEKREELERLQEEQKLLLEEERVKRKEYEDLQKRKEVELRSMYNFKFIKKIRYIM